MEPRREMPRVWKRTEPFDRSRRNFEARRMLTSRIAIIRQNGNFGFRTPVSSLIMRSFAVTGIRCVMSNVQQKKSRHNTSARLSETT